MSDPRTTPSIFTRGAVDLSALRAPRSQPARPGARPAAGGRPRPPAPPARPPAAASPSSTSPRQLPGRGARAVADHARRRRLLGRVVRAVQAALPGAGEARRRGRRRLGAGQGRRRRQPAARPDVPGAGHPDGRTRSSAASRSTRSPAWCPRRSCGSGSTRCSRPAASTVAEPEDPRLDAADDALMSGDLDAAERAYKKILAESPGGRRGRGRPGPGRAARRVAGVDPAGRAGRRRRPPRTTSTAQLLAADIEVLSRPGRAGVQPAGRPGPARPPATSGRRCASTWCRCSPSPARTTRRSAGAPGAPCCASALLLARRHREGARDAPDRRPRRAVQPGPAPAHRDLGAGLRQGARARCATTACWPGSAPATPAASPRRGTTRATGGPATGCATPREIAGYSLRAGRPDRRDHRRAASSRWCSAATARSLLGSALAMHRLGEAVGGRIGLVFVDGHSDFRHPGNASVRRRRRRRGPRPGHRPRAGRPGRDRGPPAVLPRHRRGGARHPGAGRVPAGPAGRRASPPGRCRRCAPRAPPAPPSGPATSSPTAPGYWVHVDVDVLDPAVMPAVDAPDPGGIAFPELELLLAGLVDTPHCLGVEVTVFDPDYDPDGAYAGRDRRHPGGRAGPGHAPAAVPPRLLSARPAAAGRRGAAADERPRRRRAGRRSRPADVDEAQPPRSTCAVGRVARRRLPAESGRRASRAASGPGRRRAAGTPAAAHAESGGRPAPVEPPSRAGPRRSAGRGRRRRRRRPAAAGRRRTAAGVDRPDPPTGPSAGGGRWPGPRDIGDPARPSGAETADISDRGRADRQRPRRRSAGGEGAQEALGDRDGRWRCWRRPSPRRRRTRCRPASRRTRRGCAPGCCRTRRCRSCRTPARPARRRSARAGAGGDHLAHHRRAAAATGLRLELRRRPAAGLAGAGSSSSFGCCHWPAGDRRGGAGHGERADQRRALAEGGRGLLGRRCRRSRPAGERVGAEVPLAAQAERGGRPRPARRRRASAPARRTRCCRTWRSRCGTAPAPSSKLSEFLNGRPSTVNVFGQSTGASGGDRAPVEQAERGDHLEGRAGRHLGGEGEVLAAAAGPLAAASTAPSLIRIATSALGAVSAAPAPRRPRSGRLDVERGLQRLRRPRLGAGTARCRSVDRAVRRPCGRSPRSAPGVPRSRSSYAPAGRRGRPGRPRAYRPGLASMSSLVAGSTVPSSARANFRVGRQRRAAPRGTRCPGRS